MYVHEKRGSLKGSDFFKKRITRFIISLSIPGDNLFCTIKENFSAFILRIVFSEWTQGIYMTDEF